MPSLRRARRRRRLISLTPLIDVVFILLVFFMLASSFVDWRSIELKLAGQQRTDATEDAALVISIEADGMLKLAGESMMDSQLVDRVGLALADNQSRLITIRAAEGVALQRSVDIVGKVIDAGGRNISLAGGR